MIVPSGATIRFRVKSPQLAGAVGSAAIRGRLLVLMIVVRIFKQRLGRAAGISVPSVDPFANRERCDDECSDRICPPPAKCAVSKKAEK